MVGHVEKEKKSLQEQNEFEDAELTILGDDERKGRHGDVRDQRERWPEPKRMGTTRGPLCDPERIEATRARTSSPKCLSLRLLPRPRHPDANRDSHPSGAECRGERPQAGHGAGRPRRAPRPARRRPARGGVRWERPAYVRRGSRWRWRAELLPRSPSRDPGGAPTGASSREELSACSLIWFRHRPSGHKLPIRPPRSGRWRDPRDAMRGDPEEKARGGNRCPVVDMTATAAVMSAPSPAAPSGL